MGTVEDAEKLADMILARVPDGQMTEEERQRKRRELIERWSGPGAEERRRIAEEERKLREKTRIDGIEARKKEWREVHSYRWMLDPVPCFDEDSEETRFEPITSNPDEIEQIRACAREYESRDKTQWMKGFFFDHLSHLEWDLESIIRREQNLELEFVHGRPFVEKNDPFNVW